MKPALSRVKMFCVLIAGLAIVNASTAIGAIPKVIEDVPEDVDEELEKAIAAVERSVVHKVADEDEVEVAEPATAVKKPATSTTKSTTSTTVQKLDNDLETDVAEPATRTIKKLDDAAEVEETTVTKTTVKPATTSTTKPATTTTAKPATSTSTVQKLDNEDTASATAKAAAEAAAAKAKTQANIKKLSGLLKDLPKFSDPVDAVKARLDQVLDPYKLHSSGREPIDNEQLSDGEILSWRFVYTKNYNKPDSDTEMLAATEEEIDDGNGNITIETTQPKQTFATVTLVPAGALDLEKALLLKRELVPENKYLKDVMFVKYGITWSKFPCQYERLTYYLGSDDYFHYFASADISVIYTLFRALDMKDGADLNQLLIDNLVIEDENLFTKRFCISKIGQFQDPVIPALVRSIRRIVAAEEYVIPHFLALVEMHTPKAFSIVCEAAASKNAYLRKSAFSAMLQLPQGIADLYPVYYEMIRSRDYITEGSVVFLQLGFADRLKPLIQEILDTPHSIQQFEEATRIKWLIQNRDIKTIHKGAYDDIVLSLIRSGEIKDSPQFIDMNESKAARELRLSEEDEERIADTKKKLINAKETDLSIITAIELAFFYTADKRVSRDYITRVNKAGIDLLKKLPKAEVSRIITLLIKYNTSEEEAAKLTDIRSKVGK